MLLTIANILFFLVAVAMIVLILLQRGAGAAAGSGFGAGASATVFGSRGSANFLSRSTAVLAGIFMLLALGMAIYASRGAKPTPEADDLGVMGRIEVPTTAPVVPTSEQVEVPAPAADAQNVEAAAPTDADAKPADAKPEAATETPADPPKN